MPSSQLDADLFAIAVHGGAGSWSDVDEAGQAAVRAAITEALRLGQELLAGGAAGIDVVERVVSALEDSPHFNAGRGSSIAADGGVEMDAAIMDGRERACGAVAAVRTVRNPICLARLVMSETPHVLIVGEGAERLAEDLGVERADAEYFRTAQQLARWQRARDHGTVGCVALDRQGNLAAATSTGGMTGKRLGRVGDTPLIGAGTFADNATCAVSCTGQGEHFMRAVAAFDVHTQMRYAGQSLSAALHDVIHRAILPGQGGAIAIDHVGNVAIEFTTPHMPHGWATNAGGLEVRCKW